MKKAAALLFLIMLFSAFAAVFSRAAGGAVYTVSGDGKYAILSEYKGNDAEVTVLAEYAGLPVRVISAGAFSGNVSTYKVIIPESVEEIEPGAFTAMPSLHEFEARGNYTVVDGVLFSKDGKTLVRYPEALTGSYTAPSGAAIGPYAFAGSALSSVDISGASSVGDHAFYMSALETVTVSSPVGEYAFAGSALVSAEVLSGSVGAYAFSDCERLEYADMSGADSVGEGVFFRDTSLLAASLPKNAAAIPDNAFAGCTSLVTAPIGASVKQIGKTAFCGCVSLEYAAYGSGASVSLDAFELCDKLTPTTAQYAEVSSGSTRITMKTGVTVTPAVSAQGGYDLFTSSGAVRITDGSLTAVSEGAARVYAVSRRGGDCRIIEVTVSDGPQVLGTEHPYAPGTRSFSYKVPGSPSRIAVTFSGSDALASPDTLTIYDGKGNSYGTFSGNATASRTLFIDGDTVRINLVAETGGAYGFRIVSAVPVSSLSAVKSISVPQSVTLRRGESRELSPAPVPASAFPGELVCISSDRRIVEVSGDGVVTAVGAGTADVTVYSPYYGVRAVCTVTVQDDAENGFRYEIENGGAVIVRYTGGGFFCTVPETLGGKPVVAVAANAFAFTPVRTVSVPKTVSSIAPEAFDGCFSLESFSVDAGNAVYASNGGSLYTKDMKTLLRVPQAFSGKFTVPDGVETVGTHAFAGCYSVTEVELGAAVTTVDGRSFSSCDKLKTVGGPSSSFTVTDGVLFSRDGKTLLFFPPAININTYSVPSGTESIAAYAFNGPVYLTGVVIPASVNSVDERAFTEALGIERFVVNSSNPVFSSSEGVLYENGAVKAVPKALKGVFTVPSNVTRIMPYAFYNCRSVTDIVFNSRTADIGAYAFGNCHGLYRLYLPQSVRKLGEDPFSGCSCLSVYIPDGASVLSLSDCTVMCGKGSKAYDYCVANGIPYEFTYYSSYGLYTSYSPVNGDLRVTENKNKTYISDVSVIAGRPIKAYSTDILYGDLYLPLGEYVMIREKTSSERYYLENGSLTVIGEDAASRYLYTNKNIIEYDGEPYSPRISVKELPKRTDYNENEEIDPDGLVLYYRDGSGLTAAVTEGFTLECDTSSAGVKTVSVTYNGCETSFNVNVSSAYLTGEVGISGDPRFGSALEVDLSGVLPKTDSVAYQWLRNGSAIGGATSASYTPVKEDIGAALSVRVSGKDAVGGELVSGEVTVLRAKAQTPPKPVIESKTETSVTLKKVDGCEYRLNSDGEFSDSPVFTDLTPGKTYVFYQRYKETETTEASAISAVSYTVPEILKIRSDVYFLNTANGAVSLVEPGTTVTVFLDGFKDGDKLTVYKDGDRISGGAVVGTGCEVRLYSDGRIVDKYTVVITGDVNGDGRTTITDYLQIKERILKSSTLPTPREYACDVNGDGKITITDYLRLKYCIQKGESPEQNRY